MLTERQIQFWEDVDNGLDEIENFYAKKGQNIDRIRTFSKRARGDLPPPEGCSPGHEPSEEHIDGLTAKPFWDVSDNPDLFPWASELESKSDIIQRELENNLLSPAQLFKTDSAVSETMGNGWSALRLQRLGKYTENVQLFPNTYQVAEEKRSWDVGKLTTLDTSFVHSTGNASNEDRHVLIIDFWHPEVTEAERASLEFVYDLRNKFESGAVPFRRPKAQQEKERGLSAFFKALTKGNE
ncbi:MAG: hypothetical protein SGBAC_008314 [Bacillariaceae sp.]